MNQLSDSALRLVARPVPAIALDEAAAGAAIARTRAVSREELGPVIVGLIREESALYAITRDWRYDAAGRKFLRLHALLDEQFTEIGLRLARLAASGRELGQPLPTGQGERAKRGRVGVGEHLLEAHMIRELLALHEGVLVRLRSGKTAVTNHSHDAGTLALLAELSAAHEKDAFLLRALLWEVQNPAA